MIRLWLLALLVPTTAIAQPAPTLAVLAPPPGDDVRKAVAIGPHGEVYAPDGAGAWVRTQRIATVDALTVAGRAGGDVVAFGDGVVYKLAPNGWSAIRLHQKDKAVMARGPRAVAAVKRQLYALDRTKAGEPEKLAQATAPVLAIGAGSTIVIATDRGMFRLERGKLNAIRTSPKGYVDVVDDRWVLTDGGVYDTKLNKSWPWPGDSKVLAAASGPGDALVVVGAYKGKLELLTLVKGALDRQPIDVTGVAVGVAVDKTGRAVVALADGRILLRERGTWSTKTVEDKLPAERPGSPPARSP